MSKQNDAPRAIPGVAYAAAAYIIWGVLPVYWKTIQQVPAGEILAHRIAWSFVFAAILLIISRRWPDLKAVLAQPRKRRGVFLGAVLVSLNWFIYIWAVNSNHIVEASLGYYINPLINVALGMLFLKERLNFWQIVSLTMAAVGVAIITMQYGSVPWIALSLAVSFGLYGLVKKMTNIDSIAALTLETAFMLPIALAYIILVQKAGTGSYGTVSLGTTALLTGAGIVTAIPLLCFAQGARKVTLATMGFVQYLSPSISLLIGVFMFKEAFTPTHVLSFGIIWAALAVYALSCTPLLNKYVSRSCERAPEQS